MKLKFENNSCGRFVCQYGEGQEDYIELCEEGVNDFIGKDLPETITFEVFKQPKKGTRKVEIDDGYIRMGGEKDWIMVYFRLTNFLSENFGDYCYFRMYKNEN